jgi:hypothetical protein
MAEIKTAVFGVDQNEKQAERTIDDLLAAGFSNDDVSVLLPDLRGTKDFAHDKGTKTPENGAQDIASSSEATADTPQAAAASRR